MASRAFKALFGLFGKTGGDLKYQGNLGGYKILFFVKLEMVERIKGGFNE